MRMLFAVYLFISQLVLVVRTTDTLHDLSVSDVWEIIDTFQLFLRGEHDGTSSTCTKLDVKSNENEYSGSYKNTLSILRRDKKSSLFVVDVPWPSGIIVEEHELPTNENYHSDVFTTTNYPVTRSVAVQYSAVGLRPQWSMVYTLPLFTPEECSSFISRAEARGAQVGGWGRLSSNGNANGGYKDALPSVDLGVVDVLGEAGAGDLLSYMRSSILPAMATSFGLNAHLLRLSDLHFAKYNASSGEKRRHAPHQDTSLFSFVVPLNSPRKRGHRIAGSFDGGGTRFTHLNQHLSPQAGTAVYFHGKVEHEGVEITRGVRYILVGFCSYGEADPSEWGRRYDPVFDGHAYAAGVRTGDVIRGIQTCFDDSTPQSLDEDSPAGRTASPLAAPTPAPAPAPGVVLSKVHPGTSRSEWIRMAQSCEHVLNSTLFVLERMPAPT